MAITLQTSLATHQITDFSQLGTKTWTYLSYDAAKGWDIVKFEGICGYCQQFFRWLGFYSSTHLKTVGVHIQQEANVPTALLSKIQNAFRRLGYAHPEVNVNQAVVQTAPVQLARKQVGNTFITVEEGDITSVQGIKAIVNAANQACLGGSGIDAAIHRAAGPNLVAECRTLPVQNGVRCRTGEAVITGSHNLESKGIDHIIHTVGPDMRRNPDNADALLENAYLNSLRIAQEHEIRTIAFPSISTGIYAFPKDRATTISVTAVRQFVEENPDAFDEIKFVYYDTNSANAALAIYNQIVP